jgi:hypothetical protein
MPCLLLCRRYSIPAGLYCVYNALMFYAIAYVVGQRLHGAFIAAE